MNKTTILVIGKNDAEMKTVVQLINSNSQWEGIGAANDEEAIEKFHRYHFDMALFTKAISKEEENKLCKLFLFQRPDLIIQHDGGGDLLADEIIAALEKNKKENKPTISFKDDALKNAGLKINLQ